MGNHDKDQSYELVDPEGLKQDVFAGVKNQLEDFTQQTLLPLLQQYRQQPSPQQLPQPPAPVLHDGIPCPICTMRVNRNIRLAPGAAQCWSCGNTPYEAQMIVNGCNNVSGRQCPLCSAVLKLPIWLPLGEDRCPQCHMLPFEAQQHLDQMRLEQSSPVFLRIMKRLLAAKE